MPVIVISGKPGCGSSTVAKLLAEKLGLRHFSLGDYNKSHSKARKETDKSLEMWRLSDKKLKVFHVRSDKLARTIARHGDVVIDAKLGIHMVKGLYDYGVWLTASRLVRAKRYAKRDSIPLGGASRKLAEKERAERKNWKKIYGFDYFTQEREADTVINTGNKTPKEIADMIIKNIRARGLKHLSKKAASKRKVAEKWNDTTFA